MITIVSGLPRSGTSMMMKMLEAGGMNILTDEVRAPDDDNPQGYYEYENVKNMKDDTQWLDLAAGKAVKIVSHLLPHLPDTKTYKAIFMKRNLEEVIASQNKMLERTGKPMSPVNDAKLIDLFEKHLVEIETWLKKQEYIEVLYLNYKDIINHPLDNACKIQHFLKDSHILEPEKMAKAVDRTLYRQRV
jgi:hypothetical protein